MWCYAEHAIVLKVSLSLLKKQKSRQFSSKLFQARVSVPPIVCRRSMGYSKIVVCKIVSRVVVVERVNATHVSPESSRRQHLTMPGGWCPVSSINKSRRERGYHCFLSAEIKGEPGTSRPPFHAPFRNKRLRRSSTWSPSSSKQLRHRALPVSPRPG